MRRLILLLLLVAPAAVRGQSPDAKPKAAPAAWHIDDDKYVNGFTRKLTALAKAGKCVRPADVAAKTAKDSRAAVPPVKPGTTALAPEDVYKLALPSVFAVGCVLAPEKAGGDYSDGWFATAWVASADGILVTNKHVFDTPERAAFGVADHEGTVYPVTEILASNASADVAAFRVGLPAGVKLTPLAVADAPAEVGAWVGVLSHPGHQWFTFTQGGVTRYTKNFGGTKGERWMSISADYAGGSSGAPVMNRFGAVVGVACLTSNIDYEGDEPAAEKPEPKPEKPGKVPPAKLEPPKGEKPPAEPPPESRIQMVVKLTSPAAAVRRLLSAGKD